MTVKSRLRELRQMEPGDLPAVWRLRDAQGRRDGTGYLVPPVFDLDPASPGYARLLPNAPLALVTEADGRVKQGYVCQRTVELMGFGGGREDTEFAYAHIPMVLDRLKRMGYEDAHIFVPLAHAAALQGLFEPHGFKRVDTRLAHFFKQLTEDR